MASSNPLHATFFAFRRRENGGLLLSASVAVAALLIVMGVVISFAATAMMGFSSPIDMMRGSADPAALKSVNPSSIGAVLLLEVVFFFAMFILLAAYEAACLRWMIRGEKGGLFGLTLGADTWRVYAGYWLWLVLLIVGYILLAVLGAVSAFIVSGLTNSMPALQVPAVITLVVAILCLPVWLLVRTAPAAATSIAQRKFAFFTSWRVSGGRFWALFGAFFLLWLIYLVLVLVLTGTMYGSVFATMASGGFPKDPVQASEQMRQTMTSMLSGAGIYGYYAIQFVGLMIGFVFSVLLYGINARAVIAAVEDGRIEGVIPATVAKTFE